MSSSSGVSEGNLRTHYTSQLDDLQPGARAKLAGWVEDIRPLGSLVFLTLRDVEGRAQIVFKKGRVSQEVLEAAVSVPRQSSISVEGTVEETRARDFRMELVAEEFRVLNRAWHPLPIDPTGRVESSIDARLDSRALDLRNPRVAAVFKIRHTVLQSFRQTFLSEDFIEVNTSKIIGQAAEGGATLFTIDYFGQDAYLAQSPQLYKEQLTLGLDRVFEIANYYRAEKSHTRRHLSEFTSVDIEAAFADEGYVMDVAERMVRNALERVKTDRGEELGILEKELLVPSVPFERINYREVVELLKSRGLEIQYGDDLTDSALKLVGEEKPGYYFITEWPTKLKPFYIATKESNPEVSRSFDLQSGWIELASGGMRVSVYEELERRLGELGLSTQSFSRHLEAFKWGMPPHAGWGFGLDRFVMVLTGVENVREAVLYPRDMARLSP